MAIKKSSETSYGVSGDHWSIVKADIRIDPSMQGSTVTYALYVNEQAKLQNKQPIDYRIIDLDFLFVYQALTNVNNCKEVIENHVLANVEFFQGGQIE